MAASLIAVLAAAAPGVAATPARASGPLAGAGGAPAAIEGLWRNIDGATTYRIRVEPAAGGGFQGVIAATDGPCGLGEVAYRMDAVEPQHLGTTARREQATCTVIDQITTTFRVTPDGLLVACFGDPPRQITDSGQPVPDGPCTRHTREGPPPPPPPPPFAELAPPQARTRLSLGRSTSVEVRNVRCRLRDRPAQEVACNRYARLDISIERPGPDLRIAGRYSLVTGPVVRLRLRGQTLAQVRAAVVAQNRVVRGLVVLEARFSPETASNRIHRRRFGLRIVP